MSIFYELFQFSATCNYTLCYFFGLPQLLILSQKLKALGLLYEVQVLFLMCLIIFYRSCERSI